LIDIFSSADSKNAAIATASIFEEV